MRITVDLETRLSLEEREGLNQEMAGLVEEVEAAAEMQRKGEPRALAEIVTEVVQKLGGSGDEAAAEAFAKGGHFPTLVELAKAATLAVRKQVKEKRARMRKLAHELKAGVAVKQVECEEILDYPRGQVTTKRLDDPSLWPEEHGAAAGVIETRAMTKDEHQIAPAELGGGDGNVVRMRRPPK